MQNQIVAGPIAGLEQHRVLSITHLHIGPLRYCFTARFRIFRFPEESADSVFTDRFSWAISIRLDKRFGRATCQ